MAGFKFTPERISFVVDLVSKKRLFPLSFSLFAFSVNSFILIKILY